MKLVLVKVFSPADEIVPPFGLGYLAEAVRRHGHEVSIVDALLERKGENDLALQLGAMSPDLVGVLLFSKDLRIVHSLLRRLKAERPGLRTAVGGPHPSALPVETMAFFGEALDYAFAGEAESGLPRLLSALERGGAIDAVPGLAWRGEDGTVRNNPPVFEAALDGLAVAWDLIPPDRYPRAPHGAYFRQFPVAPVITSRGCPFRCTFCAGAAVSGRRVRRRPLADVIDEIAMLRDRYGVREIHIEDDNFTGDRDYVMAFCEAMRRRCPGLAWTCPNGVRLDTLSAGMLAAMKGSGLYFLSVGIESGSDRILRKMRKGLTVARIEEKVRLVAEAGIDISGFFMLGFPGETAEERSETIRLALRLPLARASFANFQPFPGSEEYDRLSASGALGDSPDRAEPSLQSTTYGPEGITLDGLRRLRKRALVRFYARPRIVLGMLREVRSGGHAFHVARRALRWMATSR